jgi:hypothetical protein
MITTRVGIILTIIPIATIITDFNFSDEKFGPTLYVAWLKAKESDVFRSIQRKVPVVTRGRIQTQAQAA